MAALPEVGPWAKEKLDALARYLDFYTKVLKNQQWQTVYLDAYAGGGRAVLRAEERAPSDGPGLFDLGTPIDAEARELIDGSPRVALVIANPFDRYVFVDPDPDRATVDSDLAGIRRRQAERREYRRFDRARTDHVDPDAVSGVPPGYGLRKADDSGLGC